jgi:hypothetical protein
MQDHWPSKCCICSLPPAMLCGQHFSGHCRLHLDWALLVTHTAQCTDLPGTFGGILPELLEEIPFSLTRNTWFQHDWAAAHLARQVREHFTATWKDGWLGLPGHRTSHHWTSSYGATWKPWFTHGQLILKRIFYPVSMRQQQPSGRNLAFFNEYVNSCYVLIGFVLSSLAVVLNIAVNW